MSVGSVFGASFTHRDDRHVVKAVEGKLRNLRECPSLDYASRSLTFVVLRALLARGHWSLSLAILHTHIYVCVFVRVCARGREFFTN